MLSKAEKGGTREMWIHVDQGYVTSRHVNLVRFSARLTFSYAYVFSPASLRELHRSEQAVHQKKGRKTFTMLASIVQGHLDVLRSGIDDLHLLVRALFPTSRESASLCRGPMPRAVVCSEQKVPLELAVRNLAVECGTGKAHPVNERRRRIERNLSIRGVQEGGKGRNTEYWNGDGDAVDVVAKPRCSSDVCNL